VDVAADSTGALLGRQWLVPQTLPPQGTPWMQLDDGAAVVWSRPVGRGTVVVAGTPDAWAFRAASWSAFADTWPQLVMEAAARIAPAISMQLRPAIAAPGDWQRVEITARDAEAEATAATGTLQFGDARFAGREPPALHPLGDGRFGAQWRVGAPDPSARRLVLQAAGQPLATVPWVTRGEATSARLAHPSVLTALTQATGGRVLETEDFAAVGDTLASALEPARRPHPWHPMRSPWWLLPFGGALLAEWWLRRRAGLP
jgi:hypothetical protein